MTKLPPGTRMNCALNELVMFVVLPRTQRSSRLLDLSALVAMPYWKSTHHARFDEPLTVVDDQYFDDAALGK